MAQQKSRIHVGALITSFAIAALLAGPALTWGLDAPLSSTTTQVVSTTQTVVDTTQQTAGTTVGTVDSTVQSTVQAAPVQASAPTAAPAPATSTAPAQSVTRTVTAVRKSVSAPSRAAVRRPASTASPAAAVRAPGATRSPSTAAAGVKRQARTVAAPRHAGEAPSRASTSTAPAADSCGGLPLASLVPAGIDLSALLSIVCQAADQLNPGTQASGTASGALSFADLANAIAGRTTLRKRVPLAALISRLAGGRLIDAAHAAAQPMQPAGAAQGAAPATAIPAAGRFIFTPLDGASAARSARAADPAATAGHGHHGPFSNRVDGTQALRYVLLFDLLALAGLVMWRLARRWVLPRFA